MQNAADRPYRKGEIGERVGWGGRGLQCRSGLGRGQEGGSPHGTMALSAKSSEETGCFTFFGKENKLSNSISESLGTGDV